MKQSSSVKQSSVACIAAGNPSFRLKSSSTQDVTTRNEVQIQHPAFSCNLYAQHHR